eukprot:s2945_g2.t1
MTRTSIKMAQLPDRWAARILALPVFDDSFAKAVQRSPYSNLALIAAMEVHSPSEFVVKVLEWSDQLPEDVRLPLLADQFMLEQFWSLASSVEKAFFESTSLQLGFGMCDPVNVAISAGTAKARREKALKALLARPSQPPRKILKPAPEETATPLLDQENAARLKWAGKLEAIGRKAGQHSKLLNDTVNSEGLSAAENARLRQMVLSSGAPRTMQAHISAWERFDDWAASEGIDLFPLSSDKILKYALALDQRECGPSVLPSFRTSVKWVTSKLAIDCPDMAHPALLAVQDEIIKKRATTLKEAVPIPIEAVGRSAMKNYFTGPDQVFDRVIEQLADVTAHSARVTLLDAAVHAGRTTEEIGLQANWKNPGPLVLKYTRNRTSVPAHMIQQLVKDMADNAHPIEVPDDAVFDDSDQSALDEIEFFVKTTGARAVQDYRYHCASLTEPETIACGRIPFDQCTSVGSVLPDVAMLCKHCSRARPEVASRCFSVTTRS